MKAMCIFRSEEIVLLSKAIQQRAADGTLSLRRERVLHADVGLSSALIDLVSASNLILLRRRITQETEWGTVSVGNLKQSANFRNVNPVLSTLLSLSGSVLRASMATSGVGDGVRRNCASALIHEGQEHQQAGQSSTHIRCRGWCIAVSSPCCATARFKY